MLDLVREVVDQVFLLRQFGFVSFHVLYSPDEFDVSFAIDDCAEFLLIEELLKRSRYSIISIKLFFYMFADTLANQLIDSAPILLYHLSYILV